MRTALLSYSHHGRGMATATRDLGHEIVAVMDAEQGPRQQLADEFNCPAYSSAGECLDASRPDAVLVAGKHTEMPDHVRACAERGLPFLLDKPFADCAARLRPAAELCTERGVFSALTLPNRGTELVDLVQGMIDDGSFGDLVLYNSRLNNGPPSRYDPTPSAWHNDAAISGGGCWATESAHGIDTFLQFVGDRPVTAVGGVISNSMYAREVEDVAVGILRTDDGVTGIVESGYSYPSGARAGDHSFRFIGTKATVLQRYDQQGNKITEVHTTEGVTFHPEPPHTGGMKEIMRRALVAIEEGCSSFSPNVEDAVRILELQDAVYALARANPMTNGPHPLGAPGAV